MKANIAKLLLTVGGAFLAMVFDAFMVARGGSVDQTGGWWLQVLGLLAGGGGAVTTGALLGRGATASASTLPLSDSKAAFAALVNELANHPNKEVLLGPVREALIADAVEDFKKANEFPAINPPKVVVNVPAPAPVEPPKPVEVPNATA